MLADGCRTGGRRRCRRGDLRRDAIGVRRRVGVKAECIFRAEHGWGSTHGTLAVWSCYCVQPLYLAGWDRERGEGCMARLRVGIIGTGRKKEKPDVLGFAMAYRHAAGYQALRDTCTLVACADIVRENAEAFATATGIPPEGVFTDYRAMLAEANLDVVSIG